MMCYTYMLKAGSHTHAYSDMLHRNAPLSYVATHTGVLDVISFICGYLN